MLWDTLAARVAMDPFNAVATGIFAIAILHTFAASWLAGLAHRMEGKTGALLRILGEVELAFALWAVVLIVTFSAMKGWDAARHYLTDAVDLTEPMFVIVIMAIASTRPIVTFAETWLGRIASIGRGTPAAWWLSILAIGPLLGSFITEPAAMTICALVLARQFYDLSPSGGLKYATLGLLFVNVSIGGTLTHFAAPPVLMVARRWQWDTTFMLSHFGWRVVCAAVLSTLVYYLFFRGELTALAERATRRDQRPGDAWGPVPGWVTAVHALCMVWTVVTLHRPVLFIGGFLLFLVFVHRTTRFQGRLEMRAPILVGIFLGGLVIHGGLQGWWITPVLSGLTPLPLFLTATVLTAFNDNALITYLATLVPSLDDNLKVAIVEGAVAGGGLTVIANAPNPAGQALLGKFFGGGISPLGLFAGALIPTLIACLLFRVV